MHSISRYRYGGEPSGGTRAREGAKVDLLSEQCGMLQVRCPTHDLHAVERRQTGINRRTGGPYQYFGILIRVVFGIKHRCGGV